jgi:hypothetical protein
VKGGWEQEEKGVQTCLSASRVRGECHKNLDSLSKETYNVSKETYNVLNRPSKVSRDLERVKRDLQTEVLTESYKLRTT